MSDAAATPAYPVKRISRRRSSSAAPPPEQSSILRDAGAAAMTGLHTVGSLLSLPSRAVWGTANALAGGEGGFGNLNPFDSTGGIELSKFLANQGVISQNDPNKWEWGDLGRGLLDIAGDPLSYAAPLSLTKAGQAASKAGTLTKGIVPQIAKGERALVGLQVPFASKATGVLGTGEGAANVAGTVGRGLSRIADTRIPGTQAQPLRWLGSRFNRSLMGMRHTETQQFAPEFTDRLFKNYRENADLALGVARKWQQEGVSGPQSIAAMTMAAEQGALWREIDPATGAERFIPQSDPAFWDKLDPTGGLKTVTDAFRSDLDANNIRGIGPGSLKDVAPGHVPEDPVAAYLHAATSSGINVTEDQLKSISKRAPQLAQELSEAPVGQEYLTRYMRPSVRKELDRGVYSTGPEAVSAKIASDLGRQEMLKGIYGGRGMVDAIVTDTDADKLIREIAVEEASGQPELHQQIAEALAAGDDATAQALSADIITREVAIGKVEKLLSDKFGNYVTPLFKDVRMGGVERPRLRAIAEWMINHPEIRAKGVFGTDILGDMWRHLDNSAQARNNFDFAEAVIRRYAQPGRAIDRPDVSDPNFEKVGALFGSMGLKVEQSAKYLADRMGITAGEAKELTLPKHIADDLRQFKDVFRPVRPDELGRNAFQKFMSAWKAGALSWPRRIIRDRLSGLVRNFEHGLVTPKSAMDADHLWFGRTLRGYKDLPAVQKWFAENGIDAAAATDEDATEAIRRMLGSYMAQSPGIYTDVADVAGLPGMESGTEYLLKQMPGALPRGSELGAVKQGFRNLGTGLRDPFGIPGVRDIPEATFGPVKVAQSASEWTDYMNRAENFLEQLRQGQTDLDGIFNRIDAMQVSYDPRRRSPVDKYARQLFPFWSFYSKQVPYVLSDLVMNPGGRMAQTIKAADRSQQGDPNLPESVLSGTSIPLGQDETGTKSYVTGFGLMHETPAELLGQAASGDVRGIGYNLLGALNPVIQKPLEYTTGQSFFREGEKLTDLDPTVGRIASNALESLGLREQGQGPIAFPGSQPLDFAISGLPGAGSLATQVRTAVDPRRSILGKAAQLTTGVRVLKQSPEAQRKILRRRIDALAEQEGARVGEHGPYASEAALSANPRLQQIIAVRRQLDREAQQARRAKGKAGGGKSVKRKARPTSAAVQ